MARIGRVAGSVPRPIRGGRDRARQLLLVATVALVAVACVAPIGTPGSTSQVQLVSSTVVGGYHVDFYRNLAYPCSISGYQTFAIGYRDGQPATASQPLWVKMHGGGVGYFDATGTPQPDEQFMREEGLSALVGQGAGPGLVELVRNDPAEFRILAVSMCNRDLYSGGGLPDPNNPNRQPDGTVITTNGLFATKAAIQFARTRFSTPKVFLHGGSAGSFGSYSVAWALEPEAPTGTTVWARRMMVVRGFARYRSGDDLASLKPWTYYVAPATGLHRCFQNEQARNIIRVAITTAEYLFELLRFGQLLQKILIDGGSEGGVEAHVAWG